jgi:hypothetical protein
MNPYGLKKQTNRRFLYRVEDLADFSNNGGSAFLLSGGGKMRRLGRKGQSVLEYVLILTAIIAGIILASGAIKDRMNETLTHAGGQIEDAVKDDLTFN